MTAWLAARSTPLVQAACAAGLLLISGAVAARSGDPATAFLVMAVALAGAALLLVVPQIDPAVPITAAIVLSVFSSNWAKMGIPLGLDRPLMLVGLAAVAVRALPDARRREIPILRPVHLLLALVAAFAVASAAVTGTLLEREPMFALLDKLGVLSFALFFLAPLIFGTARQRNMLLAGLSGLGAYLGVLAILESLELTGLIYPRYIADPLQGIHFGRARGPFLEAAANGLAMYVCTVAACVALATWRSRRARVAAGVVVALCALGMLLTLTRQIWLGAAVATFVAMLCTARLRRYTLPALAAGAIFVLVALAAVPGLRENASGRARSERPIWDRLNSNRAAVDMVLARPLLGFGWYSWRDESANYYTQADDYPVTTVGRPHNVVLSNAVELGIPATLLWLAALALAVGGAALKRAPPDLEPWRIGMIAIFINWLVISNFTPLAYAFPNYIVWLWAGIVLSGSLRPGAFARYSGRAASIRSRTSASRSASNLRASSFRRA